MHRILIVLAVVLGAAVLAAPFAFAGTGYNHGFAWVNDDDGDGIPNGQDPDWIAPRDGSGYKRQNGFAFMVGPYPCPMALGNAAVRHQFQFQRRSLKGTGSCTGDRLHLRLRDGSCR
jgi:hypothetical protein